MVYSIGNGIIIRSMRDNDIDVILQNFAEQSFKKPREVIEAYFTRQSNGELYAFIAEYSDDIAGYVILYPKDNYGPFSSRSIPVLSDFIVFIKYQRKGIGNKLLDEAEKKAAEMNVAISLAVGLHHGYGAAQRIYIKRGYIPDGSGVWYQNSRLEQYTDCKNDDDLVLYLSKELRNE